MVEGPRARREGATMDKPRHSTDDPRHHTRNIKARLTETINHLREDIEKVHDPKAQALFETTAEVLKGLVSSHRTSITRRRGRRGAGLWLAHNRLRGSSLPSEPTVIRMGNVCGT